MNVYKCAVSGDELFSNVYKITTTADGLFYEVEGKYVTRKVGEIADCLIGGNASAEEISEGTEACYESGVDIVINHRLKMTGFADKKSFMVYFKSYLKALQPKLGISDPGEVACFRQEATKASEAIRTMIGAVKDLEFVTGESMNPEAIVGVLDYREDGVTPYLLFFKRGLEMEKC